MSNGPPVPAILIPKLLSLREVEELAEWPYPDEPFYVNQVHRSLVYDIPQLMAQQVCGTYGYYDPALPAGEQLVGFGVIHMSSNYYELTDRKKHCYIPLLSVKPQIESKGYGGTIVSHLSQEAARIVKHLNKQAQVISENLFLDVYVANEAAINCYRKNGFVIINESDPLIDEDEDNAPYFVMAKSVA